jgi:hypothetical protein
MNNARFYSQVPFDVVERPVDGKLNGKEAPSHLRHADPYGINAVVIDGQKGASIRIDEELKKLHSTLGV